MVVTKVLIKAGRRMDENSDHFNKDIQRIKQSQREQVEQWNTITELKNTL